MWFISYVDAVMQIPDLLININSYKTDAIPIITYYMNAMKKIMNNFIFLLSNITGDYSLGGCGYPICLNTSNEYSYARARQISMGG